MTSAHRTSFKNYIPHLQWKNVRNLFQPSNPTFAFIAPWIFVLALAQIPLCHYLEPGFSSFTGLILANIIGCIVLALIVQGYLPINRQSPKTLVFTQKERSVIYLLTAIYLSVQAVQFVYFRGFPLLWLFNGDIRSYADFGIKSLNGLINAMYILACVGHISLYSTDRKSWRLIIIGILLTFPILVICRQLLVQTFFQGTCALLFLRPKLWRKATLTALILLTTFVLIGNMRTGLRHLVQLSKPYEWVPESSYPLLWIFNYTVAPYSNLHQEISSIDPIGFPLYQATQITPSIIRQSWDETHQKYETPSLAHPEISTVSTFYWAPIQDFGILYAFLFTTLVQLAAIVSYRKAKMKTTFSHIAAYSVFFSILALSIFDNYLLYLPVSFQLILITWMSLFKKIQLGISTAVPAGRQKNHFKKRNRATRSP